MSTTLKTAENHKAASIHFGMAAHHHAEAGKKLEAEEHERAAHHAYVAQGHMALAEHHAGKASEQYARQFRGGDVEAA